MERVRLKREGDILRNASFTDNLMERTVTVKHELFLQPGINFQFRSPEHYKYHSSAIRTAVKWYLTILF